MSHQDRPLVIALSALAVAVLIWALVNLGTPGLEKWQTLITGILAILGALLGAWLLNRQIHQSEKHERQRIARRHAAARAVMPLALSSLCEYATATAAALDEILKKAEDEQIPHTTPIPNFPQVPVEAITAFTNMIETSEEARIGEPFAFVLSEVQVQSANIRSFCSDLPRETHVETATNIERYILQCASIYSECEALFDFARRKSDNVPEEISYDDLRRALRLMGFWSQRHDRLFETIGRLADQNGPRIKFQRN